MQRAAERVALALAALTTDPAGRRTRTSAPFALPADPAAVAAFADRTAEHLAGTIDASRARTRGRERAEADRRSAAAQGADLYGRRARDHYAAARTRPVPGSDLGRLHTLFGNPVPFSDPVPIGDADDLAAEVFAGLDHLYRAARAEEPGTDPARRRRQAAERERLALAVRSVGVHLFARGAAAEALWLPGWLLEADGGYASAAAEDRADRAAADLERRRRTA